MHAAPTVRDLALENLRGADACDDQQVGRAVLLALSQAGVDFKSGPTLEEMKCLLVEIVNARHRWERNPTAA